MEKWVKEYEERLASLTSEVLLLEYGAWLLAHGEDINLTERAALRGSKLKEAVLARMKAGDKWVSTQQ